MDPANNENSAPRASQLRPPSKISFPGTSLCEISDARHNARAQMPPPATSNLKHKPSGLPEPAAKRKTSSTEIPGPPPLQPSAPPTHSKSQSVNGYGNPSNTASGHFRNSSYSSSASSASRYASDSSRNTSGASTFASSVGPGVKPFSGSRPHSALSYSKPNGFPHGSSSYNPHRPSTTMESRHHNVIEEESSVSGKRQGTRPFSVISQVPQFEKDAFVLYPRKQRKNNKKPHEKEIRKDNVYTSTPLPPGNAVATPSSSVVSSIPKHTFRDFSIITRFNQLSLTTETDPSVTEKQAGKDASDFKDSKSCPMTPSYIPKLKHTPSQSSCRVQSPPLPSPYPLSSKRSNKVQAIVSSPKKTPKQAQFLSRYTNERVPDPLAWDTDGRLKDMEALFGNLKEKMETSTFEQNNFQQQIDLHKTRSMLSNTSSHKTWHFTLTQVVIKPVNELESIRSQLASTNTMLQTELDSTKVKLNQTSFDLDASRRSLALESDDLRRKHRHEMDDIRDEHRRELERVRKENLEEIERLTRNSKDDVSSLERRLNQELEDEKEKRAQEVEKEKNRRAREVEEVNSQLTIQKQNADLYAENKDREINRLNGDVSQAQSALDQEKALNTSLRDKLTEAATEKATLEASVQALQAEKNFLKSDSQAQSQAFADLNQKTQEAMTAAAEALEKLRKEETLRRKLHNQIQELKGNIRVFCRVRPTLGAEEDEPAKISFPDKEEDCREVMVMGPEQQSVLGKVTASKNPFSFDRVFSPSTQNSDVFEEISQLVQSALDGYNVCIFCYGQTGSGKTYTMSAEDGMIPLAVHQIYDTAKQLQEKGWRYNMEGSFVEVYNEDVNDLLGRSEDLDKKKHEIRHDQQTGKTTITDVNSVVLDSPDTVSMLLKKATANRSVAATKANERSSRSHSVFILKLNGENTVTGEKSEGTLNLVDLAGSERLAHSGATGDRLKETQNINRSLSCLGDVISALGQGKEGAHIPYRNSKLTYLLQNSLGGNSKTLMFVMISPLQAHLSETLTSLKFATKVHNTHIGSAKRLTKA